MIKKVIFVTINNLTAKIRKELRKGSQRLKAINLCSLRNSLRALRLNVLEYFMCFL